MLRMKGRTLDSIIHELNHSVAMHDVSSALRQVSYEFTVDMSDSQAVLTKGSSVQYFDEFGEFVSKALLLLF